jgi:cyclic pyranopterin phosphate synthase
MKLRVILNQKCQLNCVYCYKEGIFTGRNNCLNPEDFKTVIKSARNAGFDEIKFTGGEPLLYSYLLELVKYSKNLNYKEIRITTNGLILGRYPHTSLEA